MEARKPTEGPCTLHVRGQSIEGGLDYEEIGRISIVVQARPTISIDYHENGVGVSRYGELAGFRDLGGGEYRVDLDLGRGVQPRLSRGGGPSSAA